MRYISLLTVLSISLLSCQKSTIKNDFNCKEKIHFAHTKTLTDVQKKFKIDVPVSWSSNLYFDEYQSQINAADTVVGLTQTYISEISWNQGELKIDHTLDVRIKDLVKDKENLETVKSGFGTFNGQQSYYNLSQGKSGNYNYHLLQIFSTSKVDEYFHYVSKIYGDDLIDERLCASLAYFENVTFLD